MINSQLWRNEGGLTIRAYSDQTMGRLNALIYNTVIANNRKYGALTLEGRSFQVCYPNNYITSLGTIPINPRPSIR